MTKGEVAALLLNQAKARARQSEKREPGSARKELTPAVFGGARCSCDPFDPCDCGGRGPSQQLVLVPPAALPRAVSMTLPLPPSWNRVFKARAVPVGRGRWTAQVYKSKDAKDYSAAVGSALRRQAWPGPFERDVMLRVSGDVVMARAGCDLDDRFKVLLDSLQGHVYVNDEQVAQFGRVRRLVDSSNPRVELTFEPIAVDRYGKATT
jgi:Holliday junction resolvase RusA-like endonuclease